MLQVFSVTMNRMRVAEQTGCLFNAPKRQVKVVTVEHLHGGFGREVFDSTVTDAKAEQILQWFSGRWSIEVNFHESKQQFANWSRVLELLVLPAIQKRP